MIIRKILNNNVVVVRDETSKEQILMGNGIAFKKKVGDFVAKKQIEKIYKLSSSDLTNKFQELLAEIPLEEIELSDAIILESKAQLKRKLNDSIYISLTDHLHTAIERARKNILVINPLMWDIRRFFSEEYVLGIRALEIVEAKIGVQLPNDEAGFIALHLVNAGMDDSVEDMYKVTKIMQEISTIVKYTFQRTFDENTVYYYRFITHLKFFTQRLLNGIPHDSEEEEEKDDLLDVIKHKYPEAYQCVGKIEEFILNNYQYKIKEEEKLYLTIHISRLILKKNV